MRKSAIVLIALICHAFSVHSQSGILVFQSDFGLKDGAVGAMKGVAISVSRDLKIHDLTHEIPAYNIWEAAYRLNQAAPYWPAGTVFVSVVDPGVGSDRSSVVMKSKSGHYFVTPDNGTLTLVAESLGVQELRIIDEATNRLRNSQFSYTFHGRDVYAYTGARLAAGVISFEQVGKAAGRPIVTIEYQKPVVRNDLIEGTIDILDVQYGNVWTNIPKKQLDQIGIKYGDKVMVKISYRGQAKYEGSVLFGQTFSAVPEGQAISYLNSIMNFSLAINMENFARVNGIGSGPGWTIAIHKGSR
jgi:S-adenosylmethionine hydrolase